MDWFLENCLYYKGRSFFTVKKTAARYISALLCAALLYTSPFFAYGNTEDNDGWVLEYENMQDSSTPKYTVPTMFKNDTPFGNDRRFPLVVQDNVHYVPVEMFSGLSEIKLHTDYSYSYFYITNEEGNRYISFDADNDLATSHQYDFYDLETKVFNQTRYVPADHVAEVLGIGMEIYENPEDGVYALRFTDGKEDLEFDDLVKMYSPIKKDSETAQQPTQPQPPAQTQTPVTPPPAQNPVQPPATTQQPTENIYQNLPPIQPSTEEPDEDKTENQPQLPDISARSIFLSVNLTSFSSLSDILRTLERSDVSCAFFVRPADILTHTDEIRQIIAYGQQIGFLLDGKSPYTDYDEARENLRLVAKRTTRFVRFDTGSKGASMSDEEYADFVVGNGLCVWDTDIFAADSATMYAEIYNSLYNHGTRHVDITVTPGKNTASALRSLSNLVKSKKQLELLTCNETAVPAAHRKIS